MYIYITPLSCEPNKCEIHIYVRGTLHMLIMQYNPSETRGRLQVGSMCLISHNTRTPGQASGRNKFRGQDVSNHCHRWQMPIWLKTPL